MRILCSVLLALALTMTSSACTIVGLGTGGAIGYARQPDPPPPPDPNAEPEPDPYRNWPNHKPEEPDRPWTVGQHVAVGGALGLALDATLVVVSLLAAEFLLVDAGILPETSN